MSRCCPRRVYGGMMQMRQTQCGIHASRCSRLHIASRLRWTLGATASAACLPPVMQIPWSAALARRPAAGLRPLPHSLRFTRFERFHRSLALLRESLSLLQNDARIFSAELLAAWLRELYAASTCWYHCMRVARLVLVVNLPDTLSGAKAGTRVALRLGRRGERTESAVLSSSASSSVSSSTVMPRMGRALMARPLTPSCSAMLAGPGDTTGEEKMGVALRSRRARADGGEAGTPLSPPAAGLPAAAAAAPAVVRRCQALTIPTIFTLLRSRFARSVDRC
jgi:hypothetical protein